MHALERINLVHVYDPDAYPELTPHPAYRAPTRGFAGDAFPFDLKKRVEFAVLPEFVKQTLFQLFQARLAEAWAEAHAQYDVDAIVLPMRYHALILQWEPQTIPTRGSELALSIALDANERIEVIFDEMLELIQAMHDRERQ